MKYADEIRNQCSQKDHESEQHESEQADQEQIRENLQRNFCKNDPHKFYDQVIKIIEMFK